MPILANPTRPLVSLDLPLPRVNCSDLETWFYRGKGTAAGAAKNRRYNEVAVILMVFDRVQAEEKIRQHFKDCEGGLSAARGTCSSWHAHFMTTDPQGTVAVFFNLFPD